MRAPTLYRWRKALALGIAVLGTEAAFAADPPVVPAAGEVTPAGGNNEVEVYYGTVKVGSVVPDSGSPGVLPSAIVSTSPVLPAKVSSTSAKPADAVRDAMVDSLHAVRDGAVKVSGAVVSYLSKAEERGKPVEPHAIFLSSPQPSPVYLPTAAATPQALASSPTVVVRDPVAESHSAPPAPAEGTIALDKGTAIGLGVGALGLTIGCLGLRRRPTAVAPVVVTTAPPVGGEGVMLMGKYNAGPPKEMAERFEIGPSYQAVREEKKKAAADGNQALLEQILAQNLALQAQVSSPEAPAASSASEPAPASTPVPVPA